MKKQTLQILTITGILGTLISTSMQAATCQNLIIAITSGRGSVQDLLDKGVDPNCQRNTYTPLMMAAMSGKDAVAQLLINYGAKVDTKNLFNDTALTIAADRDYPKVVHLLILNGANVDLQGHAGNTALMSAISQGSINTARLLMHASADLDIPNSLGITPQIWLDANPTLKGQILRDPS